MSYKSIFKKIRFIRIPNKLMEDFIKRALSTDVEVGGILIGRVCGDKAIVRHMVIGKNIMKSRIRFELAPESLAEAVANMEEGEDIVAIIHSHPTKPFPSQVDMENMKMWPVIWVIVDSLSGDYKAWFFDNEVSIILD
jgi:proteasome lid subunit RPN8/RPN11